MWQYDKNNTARLQDFIKTNSRQEVASRDLRVSSQFLEQFQNVSSSLTHSYFPPHSGSHSHISGVTLVTFQWLLSLLLWAVNNKKYRFHIWELSWVTCYTWNIYCFVYMGYQIQFMVFLNKLGFPLVVSGCCLMKSIVQRGCECVH